MLYGLDCAWGKFDTEHGSCIIAWEGDGLFQRIRRLTSIRGYVLFAVCLGTLGCAISLSYPYMTLYSTSVIGMSTGAYGVLLSSSSLAGVLMNTWIAKRMEGKLDRKHLILTGMLASSGTYVAYLLFHTYSVLLPVVVMFSGVGALVMPQIFAAAREATQGDQTADHTFATSTLRSLFSLGFLIGPLVGAIFLTAAGYRGVLLGSSILYWLIAAVVTVFLKKKPIVNAQIGTANLTVHGQPARRHVWKVFIAFCLLLIAMWTYNLDLPLYIVHTLHAPAYNVGFVVSIAAGLEIPIMIGFGSITKKISNHTLAIYCCLVIIGYYLILISTTSLPIILFAQLLPASFIAVVLGNGISYFFELLPESPGMAATVYSNAMSVGLVVGSLLGGFLNQLMGYRNVYWACIVFVAGAFAILTSTGKRRLRVVDVIADSR